MKVLVLGAILVCDHETGLVAVSTTQNLVSIEGSPVLVESDPQGRSIAGCPIPLNALTGSKPCTSTLTVNRGYSDFIHIDNRAICLETLSGLTDGTSPNIGNYKVKSPGQNWVNQE